MKTLQHGFVLFVALSVLYGCGQQEDSQRRDATFKDLTVPARALPRNCRLASSGGLPFSQGQSANPLITTDPKVIELLSMLAYGAELQAIDEPGTASGEEALTEDQDSGQESFAETRARIKERAAEEAAKIKAAYVAAYDDSSPKETVVWALQFTETEEASRLFERLSAQGNKHYILKDSILIYAWTDNTEDPSCLYAIREYLEKD